MMYYPTHGLAVVTWFLQVPLYIGFVRTYESKTGELI